MKIKDKLYTVAMMFESRTGNRYAKQMKLYSKLNLVLMTMAILSLVGCGSNGYLATHEGFKAPLATPAETKQAVNVFREWTTLYQQEEYEKQRQLNHPRIGTPERYWEKVMSESNHKNGKLMSYDILGVSAIHTADIPCTELGHCYRKDMQVVIIMVDSHYKKIGDKNKEYILMTNHIDGWGWGGGTFLNIPFGESIVIMDRNDVRKYNLDR